MSDQMNNETQPQKESNLLAIVALVLAIFAIRAPWVVFGIPTIIVAVFGLIVSIVAKKKGATGGVVTAALVISIIALVLGGITLIACVACFVGGDDSLFHLFYGPRANQTHSTCVSGISPVMESDIVGDLG